MKNKFHGGTHALLQTALNLEKFTAHLKVTVRPFIFESTVISFSTRLFVNNKGQLKTIQESKMN